MAPIPPDQEIETDRAKQSVPSLGHYYPLAPMKDALTVELLDRNMLSAGSNIFYECIPNPAELVEELVHEVVDHLYHHDPDKCRPIHYLRLCLEWRDETGAGPAYTINDRPNKSSAIHLNTSYLYKTYIHVNSSNGDRNGSDSCRRAGSLLYHEIVGILTHELVHVYQYDGQPSPCANLGGLIEGMADLVRLKCGYIPPHWNPLRVGQSWDCGYERTAFFLSWLEEYWVIQHQTQKNHGSNGNIQAVTSAPRRSLLAQLNLRLMNPVSEGEDLLEPIIGLKTADLWTIYQDRMHLILG